MSMVNEFFSACTNARLEIDDVYLPMDPAAYADLLNILSTPGSYIYLTISNERTMETVRARNEQGVLILDRGLEGTEPVLHRLGSQICSITPTALAVIKDLICNYSCCETTPCPCVAVTFVGAVLPPGRVGMPWEGSIIFSGDLPMSAGVANIPSWMTATQQGNSIMLSGTPLGAGTFYFSAAATNCGGTKIATQAVSVPVTD